MKYIFLSKKFFEKYSQCTEIEFKSNRPYVMACIVKDNVTFAIPLRSNINHPHVLWTNKNEKCGLDFSKTVIIENVEYVDTQRKPYIRKVEFDSLRGKEFIVKTKLENYIKKYKKAKSKLNINKNVLLCKFSTLQYFENYLLQSFN